MMQKIKGLFTGKALASFGAGFVAGIAAGMVPAVRAQLDGLVNTYVLKK